MSKLANLDRLFEPGNDSFGKVDGLNDLFRDVVNLSTKRPRA